MNKKKNEKNFNNKVLCFFNLFFILNSLFLTGLTMNNHKPTKESDNVKSITCDICEKSFKYKSYLVVHKILEKNHTNVIFVIKDLLKKLV